MIYLLSIVHRRDAMFDIMNFVQLLKTELGLVCYPLVFPPTAPNECSIITFTDILGSKGDVKNLECTVYCRAERPDKALQNANKVIKRLDKETSLVFDDIQVLLISAITPVGRFAGVDNNGLNVFQASFKIIICDY